MKSKCRVCNKRFDAVIKNKMTNGDIQEIYFECPRCNEQYHIAWTNAIIRSYAAEIQKIRAVSPKEKEQIQEMMKIHKAMMDGLNNKMERVDHHD